MYMNSINVNHPKSYINNGENVNFIVVNDFRINLNKMLNYVKHSTNISMLLVVTLLRQKSASGIEMYSVLVKN